jgi:hypothetical protein
MGLQTLIVTIVPLGDVLRDGELPLLHEVLFSSITKKHVKRAEGALARTTEHMSDFCGIDELSRSNEHIASSLDLLDAVGCEWELRFAGASPIDRPFSLACVVSLVPCVWELVSRDLP